ncbi:MAG: phasin family protein [Halioglobus sp.]|nr:phasin family protein [Halioglobus sp.]
MSDEKSKVTDKASEIAKNIWLAGVGAYGRAVEDAQGRLEKAMEPPKLFRDLVKAGSALEDEARGALRSTSAARSSVEERINRVRENFHMQRPARIEDLNALHKKVDQLSRKVDRLSRALAEQGVITGTGRGGKTATAGKNRTETGSAKNKPASGKKRSSTRKPGA